MADPYSQRFWPAGTHKNDNYARPSMAIKIKAQKIHP